MPKAHKYDGRPWWDTGTYPLHRADGTRRQHRIDYERIPIHEEFREWDGLLNLWSFDRDKRLKARKKLWRRLRTGYYDRHEPEPCPFVTFGTRKAEPVPRCGAKCRDGHSCRARAIGNPTTGKRVRCRMHGGGSCGPRTADGSARSLAALARGRETRIRNCSLKRQQKVSVLGTVPPEIRMGTQKAS